MIKKIIWFGFFLIALNTYAQNELTLNINGVDTKCGLLHVSVFNSKQSYDKKDIYKSWEKEATNETVFIELNLSDGQYLFSVYQDSNENGVLDTNIFGIPKEPVGLSNYDGNGMPGNFEKHKVLVNKSSKRIIVYLHKL